MYSHSPIPKKKTRRTQTLLVILSFCLGLAACQDKQAGGGANTPPPVVNVVSVQARPLELKNTLAGRVTAVRSAEIRPQVSGIITKRLFEEGAGVSAGTPLYQIDPAPYKAALASAEGDLAMARANANAAELKAKRYRQLIKSKSVSQQDLDEAEAAWEQARAQVQSANAAVQTARINLDYTTIQAPISGSISHSSVTEGALVSAQQANPLAVIRQLSPVYVDVNRPAADVVAMKAQGEKVNRKVTLELENGNPFDEVGELRFSESYVDPGTGTVTSRALFQNGKHLLLPGMFVRATLVSQSLDNALLVPQRAVLRSAGGSARTYVVEPDNTVNLVELRLGPAVDDQWLVLDGLEEGDRVVISGLQNIKAGIPVQPREGEPAPGQTRNEQAQSDQAQQAQAK